MRKIVLAIVALLAMNITVAQTLEELKAEKASKKDSISAIQGRVDAIQGKIDAIPGWKKGAFGTIGASLSGFNNWYSKGAPNSSAGNIGITANAFANLNQPKYFWRNSLNINLGWVKIDDKDIDTDDDSFRSATDVFNITSLYGQKLSDKFAISTLGEYRTTIIDNFNDPGYLDLGVGATWTPIADLVVVIHPLNYNFVFSSEDTVFESSLGAKIVADYTRKLGKVNFKTNLSMFQSYKSADYSNWTWTNSFGYTLWKGIGLGFEFGLRNNRQEALSYAIDNLDVGDPTPTFDSIDNDLQTYWLFGLNYSF
ncbi:Protein of unknown function (DUF3078) [Arenibacter algicola]|jgi:hypothetical protein|uniref:DUF3078 domain-containing protein n=1 Tax=Arenibacter algicola TaxID=616991 RepID=A0ABY3AG25_9FLAO|nr:MULTISPECIES: DUF3078 domain-containing protein [Arenibacter]MBD3661817.1 DUF3078 domain-containing protein [Arenibacter algicola]GBF18419.1 hypothetical protein C21_00577 [Arenibacter sp. NBRC 103722]|tara:strand:+ start:24470 stop:25402 length:933 start_codon:yes stop_codon:yes gene_type:complete